MEAHRVASKPGSALGYVANRDVLTPSQAFAATSMVSLCFCVIFSIILILSAFKLLSLKIHA